MDALLRFAPRILLLSTDSARVRAQLAGTALSLAEAAPLRDDVSTDEITPLPIMVHFDATLGRYPYLGFKAGDETPIGRDAIRNAGLYDAIWQAFAVLLPVRTVGVMGDYRTYDSVCALRAVTSVDGMTADIYPFDPAFLRRVATRIVNEVRGINRVVYDYTSKPPGTIEWE